MMVLTSVWCSARGLSIVGDGNRAGGGTEPNMNLTDRGHKPKADSRIVNLGDKSLGLSAYSNFSPSPFLGTLPKGPAATTQVGYGEAIPVPLPPRTRQPDSATSDTNQPGAVELFQTHQLRPSVDASYYTQGGAMPASVDASYYTQGGAVPASALYHRPHHDDQHQQDIALQYHQGPDSAFVFPELRVNHATIGTKEHNDAGSSGGKVKLGIWQFWPTVVGLPQAADERSRMFDGAALYTNSTVEANAPEYRVRITPKKVGERKAATPEGLSVPLPKTRKESVKKGSKMRVAAELSGDVPIFKCAEPLVWRGHDSGVGSPSNQESPGYTLELHHYQQPTGLEEPSTAIKQQLLHHQQVYDLKPNKFEHDYSVTDFNTAPGFDYSTTSLEAQTTTSHKPSLETVELNKHMAEHDRKLAWKDVLKVLAAVVPLGLFVAALHPNVVVVNATE
ncbi:hypothetical protein AAG570_008465 [Ranatra chinensis]|uniref:Uncharacterized protein n=1 Tax=Ranatra chinensis TaxID=642074 RepID=A0ABD0YR35_9HEMI